MKIILIDPMMVGSLAVYVTSLVSNLKSYCEVEIIGNSLYDGKDVPRDVKFYPLFKYTKKRGVFKLVSYLNSLVDVYKIVKYEHPHIIHIQWLKLHSFESVFYRWLKKKYKIKVVFTAHNILPHDTGKRYFKTYKKFYKWIDAIIVHSSNTKDEICNDFNVRDEKIHIIRHGILHFNSNEEGEITEEKAFVEKYGISEDVRVFSSMGTQSYYKGTDVLIDCWAECPELCNNPKYALVIAGNCHDLNLQKAIRVSNIYIENGLLTDDKFNGIMRRTDVLVLPYRQISQSGVTMLAIDYKIPMLVTDVGGLAEPLRIANIGWIIDNCSFELLKRKLLEIIRNPEEARSLKYNNNDEWEKVQRAFSWEKIGEQTSDLYYLLTNYKNSGYVS